MFDKKLKKTGVILMHGGHIDIEGFEADNCSCREVVALALLWGIWEMQVQLAATIAGDPETKAGLDLPCGVRDALGMPDPWDIE